MARRSGLVETVGVSSAGALRRRPRALPTGRALVGGFLVALAAVVVFAAALAGAGHHDRSYVVAARPLPAGTVVAPGDVTTAGMQLSGAAAGQAFRATGLVVGRTVAVPVPAGALIQTAMLASLSSQPALRPVSVAVDATSVAFMDAGRKVDVLSGGGSGSAARVSVVMRGAVLEAVGHSNSGVLSGPSNSVVVTLGVSTLGEVEAIVQAAQGGTVTLVAAVPSDGTGPGGGP